MGQGVGLQGQSYGIPTMQGGVETIKPYVDEFYGFAVKHPEYKFLVTRIGCGIAGFTPEEIAPLFTNAIELNNASCPRTSWRLSKRRAVGLTVSTIGLTGVRITGDENYEYRASC